MCLSLSQFVLCCVSLSGSASTCLDMPQYALLYLCQSLSLISLTRFAPARLPFLISTNMVHRSRLFPCPSLRGFVSVCRASVYLLLCHAAPINMIPTLSLSAQFFSNLWTPRPLFYVPVQHGHCLCGLGSTASAKFMGRTNLDIVFFQSQFPLFRTVNHCHPAFGPCILFRPSVPAWACVYAS